MRRVFMTSRGEIKVIDFPDRDKPVEIVSRETHDAKRKRELSDAVRQRLADKEEIRPEWVAEYNELVKRYRK